jgi:hypothetical protein
MQSQERKRPHPSDNQREERRNDPATGESEEPRGIEKDIADADKKARTGSRKEQVRTTPPAGGWNDTAAD